MKNILKKNVTLTSTTRFQYNSHHACDSVNHNSVPHSFRFLVPAKKNWTTSLHIALAPGEVGNPNFRNMNILSTPLLLYLRGKIGTCLSLCLLINVDWATNSGLCVLATISSHQCPLV